MSYDHLKPTPGPWVAKFDRADDYWIHAANGTEVCRWAMRGGYSAPHKKTGVTHAPRPSDALLMAMAPEMLELLREVPGEGPDGEWFAKRDALLAKLSE